MKYGVGNVEPIEQGWEEQLCYRRGTRVEELKGAVGAGSVCKHTGCFLLLVLGHRS